jgi:hypothetical protein
MNEEETLIEKESAKQDAHEPMGSSWPIELEPPDEERDRSDGKITAIKVIRLCGRITQEWELEQESQLTDAENYHETPRW